MKIKFRFAGYFFGLIFHLWFLHDPLLAQQPNPAIQWLEFETAVSLNEKEPAKFLIYIYSDNCGWCKRMLNETFSDQGTIDYINKNFHAVKLNKAITREIKYKNRSFKYIDGKPAYHELVLLLLEGRLAYPSIAYLDENMVYLGVERGYKSIDPFNKWLRHIAENEYVNEKTDNPD